MTSLEHLVKSPQIRQGVSFHLTFVLENWGPAGGGRAGRLANCQRIAQSVARRRRGGRPLSRGGEAIAVAISIPAEMEKADIVPELKLTRPVGLLSPALLSRRLTDRKNVFLTPDMQYVREDRRACGRTYGGGRQ